MCWVHEIKFDGYRTQAHLQQARPAIYTRAGQDWTLRFQMIADARAAFPEQAEQLADRLEHAPECRGYH